VTVAETVPSGLTLVSMAGTGWACSGNSCARSDLLNGGASYPAITATVNVASNAPVQVTNQVSMSGGGSAADNNSDVTTIIGPKHPRVP
jgi:large repetitive protein